MFPDRAIPLLLLSYGRIYGPECESPGRPHVIRDAVAAWDREMSMDDVTPDHEDMPSDFKPAASSNTTKRR